MKNLILNVGLVTSSNFGEVFNIPESHAVALIQAHGLKVVNKKVEMSNTESTLIASVEVEENANAEKIINGLSDALHQDCIAWFDTDSQNGFLTGQYADSWGGEFKAEYFLI